MSLSAREKAFVREYLICRVGTQAAIKAGYAENSAGVTASKLLKKANVAAAIAEGEKKAEKRAEKTLDDVLAELIRVAFNASLARFMTIGPDGSPQIDMSNCTQEDLDLLAEATVEHFTVREGKKTRPVRRIKLKPLDRMAALVTLGKHLGLGRDADSDQVVRDFMQGFADIARRGQSAMPIYVEPDGEDED